MALEISWQENSGFEPKFLIFFFSRSALNLIDDMRNRCIDYVLMLYRQYWIRKNSFQSYPHLYIVLDILDILTIGKEAITIVG